MTTAREILTRLELAATSADRVNNMAGDAELDAAARRYVRPVNAFGIRTFKAGATWRAEHLWISPKKKHPIHCQIVFIAVIDTHFPNPLPQYYVGYYNQQKNEWWGDGLGKADDAEVTYWMPIPEIDILGLAQSE